MQPIIAVSGLSKTYKSGFQALKSVDLEIRQGEIFGLLGPNGAGKTTLINIICGIATPSGGQVTVGGHDIIRDFRKTRAMIGLVPQELTTDAFVSVWTTVTFSRGLFGKSPNPAHIEKSWGPYALGQEGRQDHHARGSRVHAKARPSRRSRPTNRSPASMSLRRQWASGSFRAAGTTIILTTHYIEEA